MNTAGPILHKQQSFELWRAGAFGNKPLAWDSIEAWRASGYAGRVVLRYLGGGGRECTYGLRPEDVDAEVERWLRRGRFRSRMMLNEMLDGATPVLQGEFFAGVDHSLMREPFFYSRDPQPMRLALRDAPQNTHGLSAHLLLKRYMTPSSYADFVELLALYPDHVLEVSVFDRLLGDLPQRNALVWEVRRF
jgi:hypothetical protein